MCDENVVLCDTFKKHIQFNHDKFMLNCHQCASRFFLDLSLFSHTKTDHDTASVDDLIGENLATAVDTDNENVNTEAEGTMRKYTCIEQGVSCGDCAFKVSLDVPVKIPIYCSHVRLNEYACHVCRCKDYVMESMKYYEAKKHMSNMNFSYSSLGLWGFSSSLLPFPEAGGGVKIRTTQINNSTLQYTL